MVEKGNFEVHKEPDSAAATPPLTSCEHKDTDGIYQRLGLHVTRSLATCFDIQCNLMLQFVAVVIVIKTEPGAKMCPIH